MKKKCLIGFDGYRDEIYRLVREKTKQTCRYWETMTGFGAYLQQLGGRSADIQMELSTVRLGGNAPLMAGAMASLGNPVICMGLLDGCGELLPRRRSEAEYLSIGKENRCTALEFTDGKLMLGHLESMELTCDQFWERTGRERFVSLLRECELMAAVNWSAFLYMNEILASMESCLLSENGPEILFFDLADFSARSAQEVKELGRLLKTFAERKRVFLGLNEKEAGLFGQKYLDSDISSDRLGPALASGLPKCGIVIHGRKGACCYLGSDRAEARTEPIENPRLLTGAGDHFNAGFCTGLIRGLGYDRALALGNLSAGHYIRFGTDLEQSQA